MQDILCEYLNPLKLPSFLAFLLCFSRILWYNRMFNLTQKMSLLGLGTGFGKGLLHQVAESFRYVKELSKEYLGPTIHSMVSSVRNTVGKIFFMKGSDDGKPSNFERNVIAPIAKHLFKGASEADKARTWLQGSHWHTAAITDPSEKAKAEEKANREVNGGGHAHPSDTLHDWGHFFHESVEAAKRSQKPEPEIGSDEWHIIEEQKSRKTHAAFLESEKASKLVPETDADELFIPGVIKEINRRREQRGFSTLGTDTFLTEKALHTASVSASDRYLSVPEDLLQYRVFPFVSREKKQEHGEAHGEEHEGPAESDQSYAARLREAHAKRANPNHQSYDEFTIPLDLMDGLAFEGDPKKFVDKLMEYSAAKESLFGEGSREKKAIGLGIQKRGTRTVVTVFLMKEHPVAHEEEHREHREEEHKSEMEIFSDEAWLKKIPEKEQKKPDQPNQQIATIYEMVHNIPSADEPFKNGYTLYQFYLLKNAIERLSAQGYHLGINSVQVTLKNPVFGKPFDGIEITPTINGSEKTSLTLIKGTDTIVSTEEYVVDKKEGEMGQRKTYQSLAEFLEDLNRKCESGEIKKIAERYPAGRKLGKGQRKTREEIAAEQAAAVEAEAEEEDEARAMGLQG